MNADDDEDDNDNKPEMQPRYAFVVVVRELRQDRRRDGVQMVGREINEVVSPTWKPDTHGPVSISPGIHIRVPCSRSKIA